MNESQIEIQMFNDSTSAAIDGNTMLADVAVNLSEAIICTKLNRRYAGNCKYKFANAFIFKGDWESDFFVQKQNGYAYEFEVKISRSDFFADKKKVEKHLILETGKYQRKGSEGNWNSEIKKWEYEDKITEHEHDFRPNKFFYVVPENMIKVEEVPKYAGLMYVPQDDYKGVVTVKEAPFIHKNKLDFESVLCSKFYNYWLEAKQKTIELEYQIKAMNLNDGSNIS
jgi:hypothetical protein